MTLARFEISSKKLKTKIIVNKSKFSFTMFNEPRKTTENAKNLLVARVLLLFMHRPWWFDEKTSCTTYFWENVFKEVFLKKKFLAGLIFQAFQTASATDTTYFVVERLAGKPKFREIIPIVARFETSFSNDSLQRLSVEITKTTLISFHRNSVNSTDLVVMWLWTMTQYLVDNVFT